jgi:sortase A
VSSWPPLGPAETLSPDRPTRSTSPTISQLGSPTSAVETGLLRTLARLVGLLLIVAGLLTLAWAFLVWQWQDPFTALYTHFKQERLSSQYEQRARSFSSNLKISFRDSPLAATALAQEARAYRRSLRVGDAVGRLQIGRIGLSMIMVQGTDEETLKEGPGHYLTTGLPGEGRLIYVAGHRTTYLAPFSHIDSIRNGDSIMLSVPYGTFEYRAFRHYIVKADDLSVLADRGREILRLQACHPRFFATHRYIVDAQLVAFKPRGGRRWLTPPT